MPAQKGRSRQPQALRCFKCGSRQVKVERGQNSRMIHGTRRVVANAVCGECANEWWSYHPEALAQSREADAAEPAPRARKPRPGSGPGRGDVDATERE